MTTTTRAFSLIEVMTAVTLFAVGLIATLASYSNATRELEHQRHMTFAINAAEATIEELLLLESTDPLLVSGSRCFDRDGEGCTCDSLMSKYQAAWSTTSHPSVAGVQVVSVVTSWTEGVPARTGSVVLHTQRF